MLDETAHIQFYKSAVTCAMLISVLLFTVVNCHSDT